MDSQIFKTPYSTQELQSVAEKNLHAYNRAQADLEECSMQCASNMKILEDLQLQHFEKEGELFALQRTLEETEKKQSEINEQVGILRKAIAELNVEREKFDEETCRQTNEALHLNVMSIIENAEQCGQLFDTSAINAEYESLKKTNESLIRELEDAKDCFENLKKTHVLQADLDTIKSLKALKKTEEFVKKEVEAMKQQVAKLTLMARNLESQKSIYSS